MLRLLLLFASVMGPAPTPAFDPDAPAEGAAVVDITFALVGDWTELSPEQLEPVLAASLIDLGIDVRVTQRPLDNVFVQLAWAREIGAEQRGRAVFWLVRRDPETVQLFVLPPGTDLGYVRDIPFAEGADELDESLAVIVRGAAESLRAGAPSGMRSLEPKPESEPEPEPEPAQPKSEPEPEPEPVTASLRVHVGLGYLGASLASNARWQSGAALDFGGRFPSGLTAAISAGWSTGSARDELTDLRLNRVPLGLAVGYAFVPNQRRVSGRIMATGVAELMWWQPQMNASLRAGSDVRLGLGVRADLVVQLYRGLGLVVGASGIGWLRNVRVDVEELDVARTVLEPGPIGGEARAGLQYEF